MSTIAPTRTGNSPNRAGREGVSAAMGRLLDEGDRLRQPDATTTAEDIRSWASRLSQLARDLADCIEAPIRNRVMELLESPSLPDDYNALTALRLNVSGSSTNQLSSEVDMAGPTIERIEEGEGCGARVAKQLADHYALSVSEFFGHGPDGRASKLYVRTVGELREMMLKPGDEFGIKR